MKKRLVFLDQNLDAGGAERVLCTIIRSLDPEAFEIHLILCGRKGDLSELIPAHVICHELKASSTTASLLRLIWVLRQIKPAILFTSLHRCLCVGLLARFFCSHYKVIARYPTMPKREISEGKLKGWRGFLTKTLLPLSDSVIAQTVEMENELIDTFAIDPRKMKVITNPLDSQYIDKMSVKSNPFAQEFSEKINLVASGRLESCKGFDVLIKAFSRVYSANKQFHLHIIGKDNEGLLNDYQSLASKLGCDCAITFHGYKENPFVYYRYCDVFILSSRREGSPNALLENLYLGKRVIATACTPEVSRLFDNGKNGFLVDVEDSVALAQKILDYHQLQPKDFTLRENSRAFVEIFEALDKA